MSVQNPYAQNKARSAVILTDNRRPMHDDGQIRYTVVLLTWAMEEFEDHDWTVKLDADDATNDGQPPLKKDSLVQPWGTYVVRHSQILNGPHTMLSKEAMKKVARAYARMILA